MKAYKRDWANISPPVQKGAAPPPSPSSAIATRGPHSRHAHFLPSFWEGVGGWSNLWRIEFPRPLSPRGAFLTGFGLGVYAWSFYGTAKPWTVDLARPTSREIQGVGVSICTQPFPCVQVGVLRPPDQGSGSKSPIARWRQSVRPLGPPGRRRPSGEKPAPAIPDTLTNRPPNARFGPTCPRSSNPIASR